jgi:transcription initiation factor IIE alpha subunit
MIYLCPKCCREFSFQEAWDSDAIYCVNFINGQRIADMGCPECGARVKEEIK